MGKRGAILRLLHHVQLLVVNKPLHLDHQDLGKRADLGSGLLGGLLLLSVVLPLALIAEELVCAFHVFRFFHKLDAPFKGFFVDKVHWKVEEHLPAPRYLL